MLELKWSLRADLQIPDIRFHGNTQKPKARSHQLATRYVRKLFLPVPRDCERRRFIWLHEIHEVFAKAILTQKRINATDAAFLASQVGQQFDICTSHQGRMRGVGRSEVDRGIPSVLGDIPLWH